MNDIEKSTIGAAKTPEELQFLYRDYTPQFHLRPLVFKNGVNIFGAQRGTGKTRFAIGLGLALVYGLPDYLGYKMDHHGNVLYLDFEMHEPEFKLMLSPNWHWFENRYKRTNDFHALSMKSHPQYRIGDISRVISVHKPTLIIVDGFKAFAGKLLGEKNLKEITNTNISELYQILDGWRKDFHVTILLTNHINKGVRNLKSHSDLMYGPGALMDYADHTSLMKKSNVKGQILIIPDKSRFARDEEGISNLIEIREDEAADEQWLELIEKDVQESEYMEAEQPSARYSEGEIAKAIELRIQGLTFEAIAEKVLGDSKKKGTIYKWCYKAGIK